MIKKNRTRFKSLDLVNNDPRVNQVFDEGEDGIWLWLESGWTADPRGAHDIHEWKVRDVLAAYRRIVSCDCDSCKGIPSTPTVASEPRTLPTMDGICEDCGADGTDGHDPHCVKVAS